MMPYILLALGLLMLSGVITYACWIRFRVWALQQDLFAIRDRLWDEAQRGGFSGDEEYQFARNGINTMIRFAPRLSLSVWRFLENRVEEHGAKNIPYPRERIPAVDKAISEVAHRLVKFIYRQTLSGFLSMKIRQLWGTQNDRAECLEKEAELAGRVSTSSELREFDRQYTRSTRGGMAVA